MSVYDKSMHFFQSYYSDYYSRYLEEYERSHAFVHPISDYGDSESVEKTYEKEAGTIAKDIEAAFLMDDIMNNGINFCAIM